MSDTLSDDLPTLLILGEGEALRPALEEALTRHATFAENADKGSAVAAVQAAAPDVVVLVGDAAERAEDVLADLAAHSMTRTVPVVVLLEAGDLAARLRAARSGVAVVERTASADAMGREIARLARELPEQGAAAVGEFGEATLGEVLDIVRRELESGILSVHQESGDGARFVLRQGRRVDQAIRDFVSRIRPLVEAAKPLSFDYDGAGAGLLDGATEEGDRNIFGGRRVALVEDDAAVADALAQELRAHDAEVVVLSSAGVGVARARHLDPEVVLVEERGLDGPAYQVLRQIRTDPRLRWASLLVIRGDELMPEGRAPRMDRLAGAFAPLLAPDEEVTRRASEEDSFDMRLEALGPSRLLRAVIRAGGTFLVRIKHPRVNVDVAVSQGLIAGADAMRVDGDSGKAGGPVALAALLAIGSGRVTIERRDAPASANVFMPLGAALEAAAQESPPIRPSVLPAALEQRVSAPPEKLMAELESVLGKLRASGMIPAGDLPSSDTTISPAPSALKPAKTQVSSPPKPAAPKKPATSRPAPPKPRPRTMPPPPPPVALGPKKKKALVPAPLPGGKPKRRKSKTLIGTGAAAPPAMAGEKTDPEQHERPTSPPPSITAMQQESQGGASASVSTSTSVSVSRKFALPKPEPGLVERRRETKTPLASNVVIPNVDPADESSDFGPAPAIGMAVGETVPPPAPDEALPPLSNESTMPMARVGLPKSFKERLLELPRPLLIGGAVAVLLLTILSCWAVSGDEDAEVVADVTPTADTPPNADPPATMDAPSMEAQPTMVAAPEAQPTMVATPEAQPTMDATPEAQPTMVGNGREETTEGPGEGASRAEVIAWNLQSGNFHRNRGHNATARRRYQAVLRLHGRNGRALAGLTRVSIQEGNTADAVRFARRLVRVNPNNAGNRVLLGDALAASGNRTEARTQWQRALRINRRHRGARRRLEE